MIKYKAVKIPIPVTEVTNPTVVFSFSSESTRACSSASILLISSFRHLIVFLILFCASLLSSGAKVLISLGYLFKSALKCTSCSLILISMFTFSSISGSGLYSSISLEFLRAYCAIRMASNLSFLPR